MLQSLFLFYILSVFLVHALKQGIQHTIRLRKLSICINFHSSLESCFWAKLHCMPIVEAITYSIVNIQSCKYKSIVCYLKWVFDIRRQDLYIGVAKQKQESVPALFTT